MDSMNRAIRGVETQVVKVAEAYQRLSKGSQRKEQAYDQLYEELRTYKDNFLLQAQKPLFKDIILLFDGITRVIRSIEEQTDEQITREAMLQNLRHIEEEILEVLYRRDIEPIEERPKVLDIELQKPIQRIETENPDEDREIVQVVREGFRWNGVILRPQEVVVKRCVKERETN